MARKKIISFIYCAFFFKYFQKFLFRPFNIHGPHLYITAKNCITLTLFYMYLSTKGANIVFNAHHLLLHTFGFLPKLWCWVKTPPSTISCAHLNNAFLCFTTWLFPQDRQADGLQESESDDRNKEIRIFFPHLQLKLKF